jgi:hypothetical protein
MSEWEDAFNKVRTSVVPVDPKPKVESWTINVNAVVLFLAAVLVMPEFRAIVHPDVWPYIVAVQAALNLALRFKTDRPVQPIDIGGLFRRR